MPRQANVRLHAHRVDHRVRTTTVSQLAYHLRKIIFVLPEIHHLDAASQRSLQPLVHQVHHDDLVDPGRTATDATPIVIPFFQVCPSRSFVSMAGHGVEFWLRHIRIRATRRRRNRRQPELPRRRRYDPRTWVMRQNYAAASPRYPRQVLVRHCTDAAAPQ